MDPKNGHFRLILLYICSFYSRYNTDWIANMEIGLDPNNSVIMRLRCSCTIHVAETKALICTFVFVYAK